MEACCHLQDLLKSVKWIVLRGIYDGAGNGEDTPIVTWKNMVASRLTKTGVVKNVRTQGKALHFLALVEKS